MKVDLMTYSQFTKIVIIFGGLFVQTNILKTIMFNVFQLVISQEFLIKKKIEENINGHLPALHTNQVDMICYFNFQILYHFFCHKTERFDEKIISVDEMSEALSLTEFMPCPNYFIFFEPSI